MTEQEVKEDDEQSGPDGWGVFHKWDEPADGVEGYMFGPFPTYEIAEFIHMNSACECKTTLVPVRFPAGIKMMASVDLPTLMKAMAELQVPGAPVEGAAPLVN